MGDEGWRLFNCDIYKDGGSLGAILAQGDVYVSLFLQVRQSPAFGAPALKYGPLFVSAGRRSGAREREASREEERVWLERLATCDLTLSELEGREGYDWDRAEHARMRWRELVAALRERHGQA